MTKNQWLLHGMQIINVYTSTSQDITVYVTRSQITKTQPRMATINTETNEIKNEDSKFY